MVAELRPERDDRTPGCSELCRVERVFRPGAFGRFELLVHDPATHEAYGASQADPRRQRAPGLVVTGPLTVDLARCEASVDGRALRQTPTEIRLLSALARRVGTTVAHAVLLADVWGSDWRVGRPDADAHVLNVNVVRLRSGLGPAHTLVVTVPGIGYRLELIEPGATPPAFRRRQQANRVSAWSVAHERCRDCGTTERAHFARGYCTGCSWRRRRDAEREGTAVLERIDPQTGDPS